MAEADMQSMQSFIGSDTALPIQSHDISMLSHPQNHSWKRHFEHFGPITSPKDTLTCSGWGICISNHQPLDNWLTCSSVWCCTVLLAWLYIKHCMAQIKEEQNNYGGYQKGAPRLTILTLSTRSRIGQTKPIQKYPKRFHWILLQTTLKRKTAI